MSVNLDEALQQAVPTHARVLMLHVANMHAAQVLAEGTLPPFELFADDFGMCLVYVQGTVVSNAN